MFERQWERHRQAQVRQQQDWGRWRADFVDECRTERALSRAEAKDRKAAFAVGEIDPYAGSGEGMHLLLTLLTGGAWAPIWIFVSIRNSRRHAKTSDGRNGRARRRVAHAELAQRKKERARDRQLASTVTAMPRAYVPAPVPVLPSAQVGPWAWVSQRHAQPLTPYLERGRRHG